MRKIAFVAGIGVGYVLGARAGKQRYEQIKAQADKAWHNPQVQEKVTAAQETVKAKAPVVGQKAKEAAGTAASAAASTAKDAASSAKDAASSAKDSAKETAASAKDAAATAKDKANNVGNEDLPETIYRDKDGDLHADTSGFGPGGEKLP